MATSIDYLSHTCVSGLTKEQLGRAAEVFISEGSGFAVAQGLLWLSETSKKVLKQHHKYIMQDEGEQ